VNFEHAMNQARRILGQDVELERRNGVCIIKREDQRLGVGPSWLSALRMASKPVLEQRQAEEKARQDDENEARKKLWAEFEEYLALREKIHQACERGDDPGTLFVDLRCLVLRDAPPVPPAIESK
jgi:hypothetical protein